MTPLEIEILLHYHVSPSQFPRTSEMIASIHARFAAHGILVFTANGYKANPEPMERYVEALRAVPLPRQIWCMPNDPAA